MQSMKRLSLTDYSYVRKGCIKKTFTKLNTYVTKNYWKTLYYKKFADFKNIQTHKQRHFCNAENEFIAKSQHFITKAFPAKILWHIQFSERFLYTLPIKKLKITRNYLLN